VAPHRDLVFFDGYPPTSAAEQTVMHLLDDGFVPPRRLPGYDETTTGGFSLWHWTEDGRFAAVWREPNSGQPYIDVLDAYSGGRVGGVPVAGTGAVGDFGGYTLSYSSDDPEGVRYGVFSVTEDGLWDYVFEDGELGADPAPDGAFFYMTSGEAGRQLYRRAPPEPGVPWALPDEFDLVNVMIPGIDSALIRVREGDATTVYRAYADGRTPEYVEGLEGTISSIQPQTDDHRWRLLHRSSSEEDDMLLIDLEDSVVTELVVHPAAQQFEFGSNGTHLFYRLDDSTLELIGFDGSTPVRTDIEGTDVAQYARCMPYFLSTAPRGKAAMAINRDRIALFDLSSPEARVVMWIDATEAEAYLSCPTWSVDGLSMVYTETGDDEVRLYRVVWNETGPAEPELMHISGEVFSAVALR
jgi:hypothetical protein